MPDSREDIIGRIMSYSDTAKDIAKAQEEYLLAALKGAATGAEPEYHYIMDRQGRVLASSTASGNSYSRGGASSNSNSNSTSWWLDPRDVEEVVTETTEEWEEERDGITVTVRKNITRKVVTKKAKQEPAPSPSVQPVQPWVIGDTPNPPYTIGVDPSTFTRTVLKDNTGSGRMSATWNCKVT